MSKTAVVAARGNPDEFCPWIELLVAELGYTIVSVVHHDGSEHNRYNLRPTTVNRLIALAETHDPDLIAVANLLHPGQMVDVSRTVGIDIIRDRRDLVYQWFAENGNRIAHNRLQNRDLAIQKQRIKRIEQEGNTKDRQLADIDQQRDQLQTRLSEMQHQRKRETVISPEEPTVVIAGEPLQGANTITEALSGTRTGEATDMVRSTQMQISINGYKLCQITLPPIVEGLPTWYTTIVPEVPSVLQRAPVVVVDTEQTARTVTEYTGSSRLVGYTGDTDSTSIGRVQTVATSPQELQTAIVEILPTVCVRLELPYSDQGHQLRSQFHEAGVIEERTYGEQMHLIGTIPKSRFDQYEQAIKSIPDAAIGLYTENSTSTDSE